MTDKEIKESTSTPEDGKEITASKKQEVPEKEIEDKIELEPEKDLNKEVKKIEMTQEELDEKMSKRAAQAERAAERKLQKQLDDLTKKVKDYEDQGLSEVEKLKKDHEKSNLKVKDLESEIQSVKLENATLKHLIKAGVAPDQLDGLVKRVRGSTEEEIEADIDELKKLGWIGKIEPIKEPVKEPEKKQVQGSGHVPVKENKTKTFTREQIKDRAFYEENRDDIQEAMRNNLIK